MPTGQRPDERWKRPAGFTSQWLPLTLRRVAISEQRLADELTQAMKARDAQRVLVLRGVVAAAKNLKVERRVASLEESDLVAIVRRELKKREEAEQFADKAGRSDIVEQNRAERAILEAWVPAQLGAEDLERAIRDIIAAGTGDALGTVMSALKSQHAGRYDGKLASDIARRVLAERAAG
jgi:uncharacterized protein